MVRTPLYQALNGLMDYFFPTEYDEGIQSRRLEEEAF